MRVPMSPSASPDVRVLTGRTIERLIDGANSAVYCTSTGTPFGGITPARYRRTPGRSPDQLRERRPPKRRGKLVGTIFKCHISRVSGKLADDAAEEACETTAKMAFTTKTKTAGCDPCVNLTALSGLAEVGADPGADTVRPRAAHSSTSSTDRSPGTGEPAFETGPRPQPRVRTGSPDRHV